MMILITGGSGSGKSAFAEERICRIKEAKTDCSLFYLATMQVYGEEGKQKVERHRRLRAGKGFLTVEQMRDIHHCLSKMEAQALPSHSLALLECMSNLTANEMFREDGTQTEEAVVDKLAAEIGKLNEKLADLVIVTNNVFEDGIRYDPQTMSYIRALGRINQKLAAMSEEVWEITAGIPMRLK